MSSERNCFEGAKKVVPVTGCDLYVVLASWDGDGPTAQVSLAIFVNPLVSWIWTGGALLLLGTALTLWPTPQPSVSRVAATAPRGGVVT